MVDIFTQIKSRSDLNSLINFMLYAAQSPKKPTAETLDERHREYENQFGGIFEAFCLELKSAKWSELTDEQKEVRLQTFWNNLMKTHGDLTELYFEMGVRIAFALAQDLDSYI